MKTTKGVVVEEKRDLKNDTITGGLGTGAGALAGLIFSNHNASHNTTTSGH